MQSILKNITLIVALVVTQGINYAQDSLYVNLPSHSKYVLDYSDQLCVKFFGNTKSKAITHFDHLSQQSIRYEPNENFNIGLGFVHKWLGVDLAFNLPFINDDDDIYGETKRLDLQVNAYLREWVIDVHYQRYQGFYGVAPWLYNSEYQLGELRFPLRPDIKTFNTAVNIIRVLNPDRFSYKAAFIYNERQIKSAGSWLAGAYLSYFTMDADKTIIPESDIYEFDTSVDFRGTQYINTGISGGYGHTFVIGSNFFISLSLVVGAGPTFIRASDNLNSGNKTELALRSIIRSAIGYNSEKVYFGISAVTTDSSQVDVKQSWLSRGVNNVKLFIGRRFETKGLLRKIKGSEYY